MTDLLGKLEDSLAYMFELQTKDTGKYISPAVQKLRTALDNYKKGPSLSLRELTTAIKFALPVIDNYVVQSGQDLRKARPGIGACQTRK